MEVHKDGHTPQTPTPAGEGALPSDPVLWEGLPREVQERLSRPLDPSLVSFRKGQGGRTFPYLEGHVAIAQANRVFGHGGWGYELVGGVTYRELKSVDPRTGEVRTTGMYFATVRVTVPGVPPRTDVGCHAVAEDTPEAHDTACKGAVTDALKRALRSFGDQFGNSLYGDGTEDALRPALREALLELGRCLGFEDSRLREAVRKRTGQEMDALDSPVLADLLKALVRRLATQASNASRE